MMRRIGEPAVFADGGASDWGHSFFLTKVCLIGECPHASGTDAVMWADEEMKRAEEEDPLLQKVLLEARNSPPRPMSTLESIAAGNAAMAEGRGSC